MKQEWVNFRTIWNAESKRIGQKRLAEIVTPDARPKSFNHSYISKLGDGKSQFTEEIIEKFAEFMKLPIAKLFSTSDQIKLSKEAQFMVEIEECLQLMLDIPEFKRGILAHADLLKATFKDQVAVVKKTTAASAFLK